MLNWKNPIVTISNYDVIKSKEKRLKIKTQNLRRKMRYLQRELWCELGFWRLEHSKFGWNLQHKEEKNGGVKIMILSAALWDLEIYIYFVRLSFLIIYYLEEKPILIRHAFCLPGSSFCSSNYFFIYYYLLYIIYFLVV